MSFGLNIWSDGPNGKIIKSDVVIAKNYLNEELYSLRRIVSAYLDLAKTRAIRHIPMTMEDWSNRLDEFLKLTDREILKDAGKISHKIACDKAESEFEKYRITQDQIYISDFDKYINELEKLKGLFMSKYKWISNSVPNGKIYKRYMANQNKVKQYLNYPDLSGNQMIDEAIKIANEKYQFCYNNDKEYFV